MAKPASPLKPPDQEPARMGARYRLRVGQRFYRVDYPSVVWRVAAVYFDAQDLEHAHLTAEGGRLEEKTLSATVLLDRSRYRPV